MPSKPYLAMVMNVTIFDSIPLKHGATSPLLEWRLDCVAASSHRTRSGGDGVWLGTSSYTVPQPRFSLVGWLLWG